MTIEAANAMAIVNRKTNRISENRFAIDISKQRGHVYVRWRVAAGVYKQ